MKNNIEVSFVKFDTSSEWVKGKVGPYTFSAKLFAEDSIYAINQGRVSKLSIYNDDTRLEKGFKESCIVRYNLGWEIKPNEQAQPFFEAVMKLLEKFLL